MRISAMDRAELLEVRHSESMREDLRTVSGNRHHPFGNGAEVDPDLVVEFLTQYNEFLNHPVKPWRPFEESNMKL